MASSLDKLKDRKVVQWSLGYLAMAWVFLEALAFATDTFALPPAVLRVVSVLSLFGLHAVIVVAWFHGELGEQRVRPLEVVLLALLTVGATGGSIWAARTGAEAAMAAAVPEPAPESSIAVLPFVNMSGRAEEEYFSDGITEEILNALTQVPGLRVAARTSSFAFKARDQDVRGIGASLGVRAVLEGSVRREGDRVMITAQLIDAVSGYHLWSNTFERPSGDIFGVQVEIARAIANALELRLVDQAMTSRPPTRSAAAYDLYLRGRQAWNLRTAASLREAIDLFGQAVDQDPGFALAYSGLADSYGLLEDYGGIPAEEAFPLAIQAAQQALEIDETGAEAHAALGHVYMHQFQWQRAEDSYHEALRLNPSYAMARHWYSLLLMWTGRHEEALAENVAARRLDPLSEKIEEVTGVILFYGRRYQEALEHLDEVTEKRPDSYAARRFLALTQSRLGLHDEALATVRRSGELAGASWTVSEARVLAEAGRREEARALLEGALRDSPELRRTSHDVPAILVALGNEEEALAVLDEATPTARLFLGIDPVYDGLRDEPRFRTHLVRLGLTPPGSE